MYTSNSRKIIVIMAFVIIVSISAALLINLKRKPEAAETVARAVLTKAYSATLQDYERLTNAITQSSKDNKVLVDYLHSIYGEQLTENGYKIFIANRIPSRSADTAHEENSDLKVSSIELEPEDALEGSERYSFTIQVRTLADASANFIFKGNIALIQEDNQWKVDGASPD